MNMTYAGIGSRETPERILEMMRRIGAFLGEKGWMLRSGGAKGADKAFEFGCNSVRGVKEIFRSEDAEFWALEEAARHIPENRPPFEKWKPYLRGLIARNMMQVLGRLGDEPVAFVLCWTQASIKDGGGTGYALRCSKTHGIPVYNMNTDGVIKALHEDVLKGLIFEEAGYEDGKEN